MAAIDFPASPSTNQTHTASGITWTWDGTSWKAQGSTTTYTLPTASSGTLGGIKVGGNFAIDGAGTLSLSAAAISGLSDVTATNADYLMLWDATDSSLKKVDAGELIGGGGGGGLSSIGIQSGGTQVGSGITQLNFIGAGDTFAVSGNTVDVSIGVDSVDAILPVAYAVVGTNSAGTGTGMSWGAYNSSTKEVVFTFDTAQPNTNYYVHTNREQYATHNIEVTSKSTTGFTTKWTNSDTSALPPGTFKGVLIVYGSNPLTSVGALNTNDGVVVKNDGSLVGTAGTINFGDSLSVTALSAGIVTVTSSHIRAQTLTVAGVSTFTGNIDANGMLDVDGPTHLDYVSVSGVTTFNGNVNIKEKNLILGDSSGVTNDRIVIGTGSDLHIFHNTLDSHIDNNTGNLILRTNVNSDVGGNILLMPKSNENGIIVTHDASVELYENNVKRLETTDTGINVTGDIVGSGSTAYSTGLIVGKQGAEFQGVVTATTFVGALTGNASGNAATATLATNAQGLTGTPAITVGALTATTGQFSGDVNVLGTLTYEDVKNVDSAGIATARQGLRITGGGLDVVGVSTFNDNVKLLDNDQLQIGTGGDLKAYHDGSNSYLSHTTGALRIIGSPFQVKNAANNAIGIEFTEGNSVDLYYNGSKKFETTSSGAQFTGTDFGFNATPGGTPASKAVFLAIGDSDTGIVQDGDGQFEIWGNAVEVANFNAIDGYTSVKPISTTDNITMGNRLIHSGDTDTYMQYGTNEIKFTTGGGTRLLLDANGNVTINSTTNFNNSTNLDVRGGTSAISDGGQIMTIGNESIAQAGTQLAFGIKEDDYTWIRSYESGVGGRDLVLAAGDEKLRIKANGKIDVGGNESGYKFNIIDESNRTTTAETALLLYAKHDGSGTTGAGFGTGIRFWGDRASGNVEQNMGRIMCTAEVNSGTTLSGALSFQTSVAGSLGERLRIDSVGKLLLGTGMNSNSNGYKMSIKETSAENAMIIFLDTDNMRGGFCGIVKGANQVYTGTTNVDFLVGSTYANTTIISGDGGNSTGVRRVTVQQTGEVQSAAGGFVSYIKSDINVSHDTHGWTSNQWNTVVNSNALGDSASTYLVNFHWSHEGMGVPWIVRGNFLWTPTGANHTGAVGAAFVPVQCGHSFYGPSRTFQFQGVAAGNVRAGLQARALNWSPQNSNSQGVLYVRATRVADDWV